MFLRRRENIKRWHKAFIWALLAGVAKKAVAGAKFLGKTAVDTAWKVGETAVTGVLDPAEKAFEAFKSGGAEKGLKVVGKELMDSSDIKKSMDLIQRTGDIIKGGMTPGGVRTPTGIPNVNLGRVDINKPGIPAQAPTPVQGGAIPPNTGITPQPSTFNKAFLDSLVGKQPDLQGAGRMAYLGDTLADLVRTGAKLQPTQSTTGEDRLDLEYKQARLAKIQSQAEGFSPELQKEVDDAIEAISAKDSKVSATELYRIIASKYPKHSATLKRIFLPKAASIVQNIFGEADTFMGVE